MASNDIIRSTIWFDDGSIVLQAEQTQFCVYGGFLANHSIIFRDMLSVPQAQDGNTVERVDGHPLVHLSDSAAELTYLLEALHDQSDIHNEELDSETAARFCAVLRLSTKYTLAHLRQATCYSILSKFPAHFPSRLQRMEDPLGEIEDGLRLQWAHELANILREATCLSPLPALLHCISRAVSGNEELVLTSSLSFENKHAVLYGLKYTRSATFDYLRVILVEHKPPPNCATPVDCQGSAHSTWSDWTTENSIWNGSDPLFLDNDQLFLDSEICPHCSDDLTERALSAFGTNCRRISSLAHGESWKILMQIISRAFAARNRGSLHPQAYPLYPSRN